MSTTLRWIAVASVILGGWAAPPSRALAASLDTIADRVVGQLDFAHGDVNRGLSSPTAQTLANPYSMVLDGKGNLYVADTYNNRVLAYETPLTSGMAASLVLGQPDFTTSAPNRGSANPSADGLFQPVGVALDALGDLYVTDYANNRVLEYDAPLATGMAATRVLGQADFTTSAPNQGAVTPGAQSLWGPGRVALDAQGNLYLADTFNNRVLEFYAPLTSDMAAGRVLGQPDFSQNGANRGAGTPGANTLWAPGGVAVDVQGNLYVADAANNRVLEYYAPLTSDERAYVVFGQPDFTAGAPNQGAGTPSANSLWTPGGVGLDAQGDLYVADFGNQRVLEYDAPSPIGASRVFGQPDFSHNTPNNPSLGAGSLYQPVDVALDAQGNLYVADAGNNRTLEYDVPVPHGMPVLSTLAPSTVAAGSPPFTLTVTGSGFVLGSVVRWNGSDRPTTFVSSTQLQAAISAGDVAGGGPFAVTVFTPPPGGGTSGLGHGIGPALYMYARAGQDAIADMVQGQPSFNTGAPNNPVMPTSSQLYVPYSVAVDPHSGRLFVADTRNSRVLSWPNAAAIANAQPADLVIGRPDFLAIFPYTGDTSARSLSVPTGVALDGQGNLYVADADNNRVLEYDAPLASGMAANRVFGQGGSFITGSPNHGGVSANSLNGPVGVALDARGDLYVADTDNNRVLEFNAPLTSGMAATHVFGQPDFSSNTSNRSPNGANNLNLPTGVALNAQGDLFVADVDNSRVLEYFAPLATGMAASRVFGQANFTQTGPNQNGLNASSLAGPRTVAVDRFGELYVSDTGNDRVLEYEPPLGSGMAARRVFGQPDFTHNSPNNPSLSASSQFLPLGMALDAQSNLYVADLGNNRVLEYDWALVRVALPLIRRSGGAP